MVKEMAFECDYCLKGHEVWLKIKIKIKHRKLFNLNQSMIHYLPRSVSTSIAICLFRFFAAAEAAALLTAARERDTP